MPQRRTQPAARAHQAEEEAPPLASAALRIVDHSGRRRQGRAVVLPRGSLDLISARLNEGEDFRIVMLVGPPDGPVSPAEGIVVAAPARPLTPGHRLAEAAPPYRAGRQTAISLPPEDLELLRRGQLYSHVPLRRSEERR